ncbi:MAG: CRISPR-associated protein Cas4 [Myxococcota bacterium]
MTSLLPARMLNELAYCPRLFHLEWVQREWDDSRYTADGKRVHRRVDRKTERASAKGKGESGPEPRVQRSVDVADETLGLVARINLTELEGSKVVPVDYKRGACPDVAEGAWEPERVQVAAQIMLLRAHGLDADHGELYFAESRRRVRVDLTPQLERRVLELRDQALEVAGEDKPPPPLEDDRKCRGCSLAGVCLPEETKLLTKASTRPIREVRARRVDAHPLHVTQPGSVIRKDGEELVVEPRDGDVQRVRLVEVSSVQLHGASKITTPALHALLRENIAVSYLSRGGWLYG